MCAYQSSRRDSGPPVRIGLVGAGPWARMFHAPMIAAHPRTDFAAVWARRPNAAATLAACHGAQAMGSFDELLRGCDAVAFAVPPDVQARLAVRAAAAGKHLLLDKPLARDVQAAEAVAAAASSAGIVTQIVLTNRYTGAVRSFLESLDGSTARAVRASFVSGSSLPGSPFAESWAGADASLLNVGPHVLDIVEAVAGPTTEISTVADPSGCLCVTGRHADGAVSQALLSTNTPGTRGPLRCEVVTDTGLFVMGDPNAQENAAVQHAVIDAFVTAVVAGRGAISLDVHHGLRLQRLLAAAQRSREVGRPVHIPSADMSSPESAAEPRSPEHER